MIIRVKRGNPLACLVPEHDIYDPLDQDHYYLCLQFFENLGCFSPLRVGGGRQRQCRYELFRLRAVSAKARERREARQHRAKARPYPKNLLAVLKGTCEQQKSPSCALRLRKKCSGVVSEVKLSGEDPIERH
jgi:hypothetical protein